MKNCRWSHGVVLHWQVYLKPFVTLLHPQSLLRINTSIRWIQPSKSLSFLFFACIITVLSDSKGKYHSTRTPLSLSSHCVVHAACPACYIPVLEVHSSTSRQVEVELEMFRTTFWWPTGESVTPLCNCSSYCLRGCPIVCFWHLHANCWRPRFWPKSSKPLWSCHRLQLSWATYAFTEKTYKSDWQTFIASQYAHYFYLSTSPLRLSLSPMTNPLCSNSLSQLDSQTRLLSENLRL